MSWNQASYVPADVRDTRVTAFLTKVYGWMFLGLLITAGTALVVASSPFLIETFILNRVLFWILILGQLGLVFFLSVRVDKIAPATAAGAIHALFGHGRNHIVSNPAGLHRLLHRIDVHDYGWDVWRDGGLRHVDEAKPRRRGPIHVHGIDRTDHRIGREHLLANSAMYFVISVVGVIVFTGLTAWDAQRLKEMAVALPDGTSWIVCRGRSVIALPRLHQPVFLPAEIAGRPPRLRRHNPQITQIRFLCNLWNLRT